MELWLLCILLGIWGREIKGMGGPKDYPVNKKAKWEKIEEGGKCVAVEIVKGRHKTLIRYEKRAIRVKICTRKRDLFPAGGTPDELNSQCLGPQVG